MWESQKRWDHIVSIAFRQWRATSHCRFVHGYGISVEITYAADDLDANNWVVDFGGLKLLENAIKERMDHRLIVAQDDPLLDDFLKLEQIGAAQLLLVDNVSCECFAAYIHGLATAMIPPQDTVWLRGVRVEEHAGNSASYFADFS